MRCVFDVLGVNDNGDFRLSGTGYLTSVGGLKRFVRRNVTITEKYLDAAG